MPLDSESEDRELARQARAGSMSAFEQLVLRYEGRIYSFVLRQCGNGADAQEITQDTFVRAWRSLDSFKPEASFRIWLFTIARRRSIDAYRAARKFEPMEVAGERCSGQSTPAEAAALAEEENSVWKVAQRVLPPQQFQAFWLRYGEGMEVREIAAILRKTRTSVKVMLFRGRLKLARHIGAFEQERKAVGASRPAALSV